MIDQAAIVTGGGAAALSFPGTRVDLVPDGTQLVELAFRLHAGGLVRRLTSITREPAAAEDLAQEAFARLAIEVAAGRAPENAGAWLHRVGTNLAMSRGRKSAVAERRRAELPVPGTAASPEVATVQAEEAGALHAVLADLPDVERTALLLAAHGYRGPEIARHLGRTDGATRTLLCRARQKVRARLEAAGIER